jgi:hypothetical protein
MANQQLDAALNSALAGMSTSDLQAYQDANKEKLISKLTNDMANSFNAGLRTATGSAVNYDILSNYVIQSKNLDTTLGELAGQNSTNTNIAEGNAATNSRVREIKEWYYNNKLDTLFVFQLIFISVCFLAVLAFLIKLGFINSAVFGICVGIAIIVMILLIANRAVYTDKVRDKRYWSKRNYGIVGSPLPGGIVPTKCP